jgi:outer membrane protein assembly factor BamE
MFRIYSRIVLLASALFTLAVALPACSTRLYKADVVQGNFVSKEQVAALRTGMPKPQVRNILGTPLLTDIFHADRWDYVFTMSRNGAAPTPRRLTVYFKGETLDKWDGDVMPSEVEFVQSLDSGRKVGTIPPLAASERELADFAARENPSLKTVGNAGNTGAAPNIPAGGAKTYPPLEAQ